MDHDTATYCEKNGKAAENGLFAALLANEGIQGPIEALEGSNGWFHAVTDKIDYNMLKGRHHLLLHDMVCLR